MPDMMTAYAMPAAGRPLERLSRPVPRPGRGQAVVRNLATSVNYHDLLNLRGLVPFVTWPRVPFSDNCGEVVALGPDAGPWALGDRVIANFFVDWIDGPPTPGYCGRVYGDQLDGFLASHALVETGSLVRAPAHLSAREAATLACAGLTAWRALVVEARVGPGDVVVVQGTGGVSLFAVQFAKMLGAEVILLSSSDEKLAFGRAVGADRTHDYRADPAWDAAVMAMTGGRGADVVVDIGGAETLGRSLNAVKLDGHVSVVGIRAGPAPDVALPVAQVLIRNITLRGITVGSRAQLEAMCRAVELNGVRPVVDRAYPLDAVDEAVALMESQAHRGKIVVDVAEGAA